jgi:hypothetical protein
MYAEVVAWCQRYMLRPELRLAHPEDIRLSQCVDNAPGIAEIVCAYHGAWLEAWVGTERFCSRAKICPRTGPNPEPSGKVSSLSRPMSSLALITSYRRHLALRLTCHTGLSLLFEVGVRPPHDGVRRMGRPNLSGAVAAD